MDPIDLRDVGPGSMALTLSGSVGESCFFEGEAELTIDESVGGSAPYPAVVTPDYKKVFHVRFGASIGPCVAAMGVNGTLAFTTTAADIHANPNDLCPQYCPI
jgi:hypothetical protein